MSLTSSLINSEVIHQPSPRREKWKEEEESEMNSSPLNVVPKAGEELEMPSSPTSLSRNESTQNMLTNNETKYRKIPWNVRDMIFQRQRSNSSASSVNDGRASTLEKSVYLSLTAIEVVKKFAGEDILRDKVAIVTGGSSGIGLETVKALAYSGCKVIMCTSSFEEATFAISSEILLPGLGQYVVEDISRIIVKYLDLSDLQSIATFASEFQATESRIDYLILNEDFKGSRLLELTSSGFEKQVGINHFGHAYLTSLLRATIEKQEFSSRIVVLTSSAYERGTVNVDDLHYQLGRYYSLWPAYAASKLANLLYAKRLSQELKASRCKVLSVNPGIVGVNLKKELLVQGFFTSHLFDYRKTIPQGACTTLWACLVPDDECEGFQYLSDCQIKPTPPITLNQSLIDSLWSTTHAQLEEALKSRKVSLSHEKQERRHSQIEVAEAINSDF